MPRVCLSLMLCFAVSPFVQSSPALRSLDDSPAAAFDALSSNAALSATFLETHSERVDSAASRAALFTEGGDPPPDAAAPPAADPVAAPAAPQADGCSVCTYVLENKEVQQPFLCRGLSDPAQQIMCVKVLMSLLWWMDNQVYWINYGCQRNVNGAWSWVRPCPPHAICSWIKPFTAGAGAYCPEPTDYRKPQ